MKRYQVLEKLVKENGLKIGVEVGIWAGATFFNLLRSCPGLYMIGIDQYKQTIEEKKLLNLASCVKKPIDYYCYKVFHEALKYEKRCKILKLDSISGSETVENESVDFVFIDADHRESFVRADIAAWLPKIKQGGFLTGHDTHFSSVKNIIDEIFPEMYEEYPEDHVWVVRKEKNLKLKGCYE